MAGDRHTSGVERIVGHKIGLSSFAMREQLGGPDYGKPLWTLRNRGSPSEDGLPCRFGLGFLLRVKSAPNAGQGVQLEHVETRIPLACMCLIFFSYEPDSRYRLVLAANRDEFYARPTAPAAFWEDAPDVLAGRDLEGGGTWMGVTRGGKVAMVTNFREPGREREISPSRGRLVSDFLTSDEPSDEFLDRLRPQAQSYNGFNLLLGSAEELWWYSNRNGCPCRVTPGTHGLSNRLLDTPWPKVERSKRALEHLLTGEEKITPEQVFTILEDRSPAADSELPDTGVGLELERMLSAPFIRGTNYGTRSSTVLLIDHANNLTFVERSFNPKDESWREVRHEFRIEP